MIPSIHFALLPHHAPQHQVADNRRILSPSGNQLLWLPRHWQSDDEYEVRWGGMVLVVANGDLIEPIILRLEV